MPEQENVEGNGYIDKRRGGEPAGYFVDRLPWPRLCPLGLGGLWLARLLRRGLGFGDMALT